MEHNWKHWIWWRLDTELDNYEAAWSIRCVERDAGTVVGAVTPESKPAGPPASGTPLSGTLHCLHPKVSTGNHTTKQRYLGWYELEIISYHGAQVRKLCCGWLYPGAGTLPPHLHCLYHAGFISYDISNYNSPVQCYKTPLNWQFHREAIQASSTCPSLRRWPIVLSVKPHWIKHPGKSK